MATIGALIIDIQANTARLQQDMAQAVRIQQDAANAMNSAIETTKKALVALGVTAAALKFVDMIRGSIDAADAMGKQAEKASLLVEQYSALVYAAKKLDVDQSTLDASIKKLNVSIAGAVAGGEQQVRLFTALGVAYKDSNGDARNVVEVMRDLSTVFAGAKDDPVKIAYAIALMGKAGEQAIPMLNKGGAEIKRLMEAAEAAGKVMDKETAEAADKFNKNIEQLTNSSQKLAMVMAKDLLPDLQNITNAMIEARKEGGTLLAIWVGLGGVMNSALTRGEDAIRRGQLARIKELEAFIAENENTPNPVRAAMIGNARRELAGLRNTVNPPRALDVNAILNPQPTATWAKTALDAGGLKGDKSTEAVSKADAELRKYTSAMRSLEEQQRKLMGETDLMSLQYKILKGTLADLTPAHKKLLEDKAKEIDLIRINIETGKALAETYTQMGQRQQAWDDAIGNFNESNSVAIQNAQFQIDLIGKTAAEQERLNALYSYNREVLAQLRVVADDPAATEKVHELANAHRQELLPLLEKRRQLERDWQTGATVGLQNYIDEVTNAAKQTEQLIGNAFRGMEDALVSFVKTGKLDFRSLADSIISDLIRIQVRQGITKPLAEGLSSATSSIGSGFGDFIKSIFGGGRAGGGDVSAGMLYRVNENGPELLSSGGRDYLMMGAQGGTITPNGGSGGGSVTFAPQITFQVYGDPDRRMMAQVANQAMQQVKGEIFRDMGRGGAWSRAVGQA